MCVWDRTIPGSSLHAFWCVYLGALWTEAATLNEQPELNLINHNQFYPNDLMRCTEVVSNTKIRHQAGSLPSENISPSLPSPEIIRHISTRCQREPRSHPATSACQTSGAAVRLCGFLNDSLLHVHLHHSCYKLSSNACNTWLWQLQCPRKTTLRASNCLIAKQTVWVIFLDRGIGVQVGCSQQGSS